jgi:RNA polymerase sigma-54 factor
MEHLSQGTGMNQGARVGFRQDVGLKVDPKLLLSSQVLQYTQQELEQAISTELNENPALERLVSDHDPITDRQIEKAVSGRDLKPRGDDRELWRSLPVDDTTPSWIDLKFSESNLSDHLRAQLMPLLPTNLRPVGEYVIGSLNENGYLHEPVEEIALGGNCSIEDAQRVVTLLKSCEPAGIGASGIQESLFLQLKQDSSIEGRIAKAIVKEHLDLFTAGKVMKLARKFSVNADVINAAFAKITACTPFPGDAFRADNLSFNTREPGIQPDLVLTRDERGWEIEVKGPQSNEFTVNGYYKKRLELDSEKKIDKDEKRHLTHYVDRARDFIDSLEMRKRTLLRIGQYLIERQAGFVSTGDAAFLQPLTRTQLAHDLELHESTISRATQGKYVQLSNSETVSFDVFFKPALRIQKMIEEILATENPDNPLSDERISQMLADKGVHVARRTVNKYRDRTKLLSSRKRRSA